MIMVTFMIHMRINIFIGDASAFGMMIALGVGGG